MATLISWALRIAEVYLVAGVIFALAFVLIWAGRMDSSAATGTWGFRLSILPGVVALWPLIAFKTAGILRAHARLPEADPMVPASRLRKIHGLAFGLLLCVVPALCIASLLSRPRVEVSSLALPPAVLADVVPVSLSAQLSETFLVNLRSGDGRQQVELGVKLPLDDPAVALYWSPHSAASGVPRDAVFLGSVWGPATLLFDLPKENRLTPGFLTLIALAGDQHVIASFPLHVQ